MSNEPAISSNGIKPTQNSIAKSHEIWLNSDRFTPESSTQDMHFLSDAPEILELHQTKVESARLVLSEKTF